MIRRIALLGYCLGLGLAHSFAFAAEESFEPSITVKAEVDHASITIGDPVDYKVTIRHKPSVQILSSIAAPPSNVFKVKKIDDIREEGEDYLVVGKKFTLTTFRLGNFILDPIEVQYREKGVDAVETLSTEKIYLKVKSVAEGEEKQDIRAIKSVVSIPQKIVKWLVWGLGILLLVLAVWIFIKIRKKPLKEMIPERILSNEEQAFLRLNQLFDSDLIRREKYKLYYLSLSEILRAYIEKRYNVLAVEATTTEIQRYLKNKAIDPALRDKIHSVLTSADLAKFAKWKPEPSEIISLNHRSKQIVEESAPKKTEVKEEVAQDGV